MNPAEMQVHTIELAAAKGVVVIIDGKMSIYSCFARTARTPENSCIHMVPVLNDSAYVISLHELGHILDPNGCMHFSDPQNKLLKLQSEENAWKWARANAKVWTPQMEVIASTALRSYTHGTPPPDIPGYETYAEYAAKCAAGSGSVMQELVTMFGGAPTSMPVQIEPPVNPALEEKHRQAFRGGLRNFGKRILDSRRK